MGQGPNKFCFPPNSQESNAETNNCKISYLPPELRPLGLKVNIPYTLSTLHVICMTMIIFNVLKSFSAF